MDTLIFFDEVVPHDRIDELPDETVETTERELAMAKQLVESLATAGSPSSTRTSTARSCWR
jgi:non-homologous end joining protein Ku